MTTNIVFVDVDGVLNTDHPNARVTEVRVNGSTYVVRYWPNVGANPVDLATACDAELMWATSWQDEANTHIAPLFGLPALPVVAMPPRPRFGRASVITNGDWKLRQITAALTDRPCARWVWFDDDAPAVTGVRTPAGRVVVRRFGAGLAIRVPIRSGLTPAHLAAARHWLTNGGL